MQRLLLPALLLCTTGCSSFSFEEAQAVARANAEIGIVAYRAAWSDFQDASRRGTEATLDWTEGDTGETDPDGDPLDGWSFSGTLTSDGPVWTGAITADGSLGVSDSYAAWGLDVGYDQVSTGDMTVDGDLSVDWWVDLRPDGFEMAYEVVGDLAVTGDIVGEGDLYNAGRIEVTGSTASVEVIGDVDGRPVDFSMTLNVPG